MSGRTNAVQKLKIAWSNGLVQASLPEWISPTWTTSSTLGSALIVSMNAAVLLNSAPGNLGGTFVQGGAGSNAGSKYGESPKTASVSVLGFVPAARRAAIASATAAMPSAMSLFINPPQFRCLWIGKSSRVKQRPQERRGAALH